MTEFRDFISLWCDLLFEELCRTGIRHICVAPGSRSAPLTLAAERNKRLLCHCHFDERGLGFFALGLARRLNQPVVLVTTSGTAVANLAPALQEARESGVALLVLSSDRPPELLDCGANQTLRQTDIFGTCPVKRFQLPPPSADVPARWLLGTIDEAVATLQGPDHGVVHINQALREPLYGQGASGDQQNWLQPLKLWSSGPQPLCQWQSLTESVAPDMPEVSRVVLVAGQLSVDESAAVLALAERTGWLLVADIQSGLQGHKLTLDCADLLLGNSQILTFLEEAELIIQLGRRLVSKRLGGWLSSYPGSHWFVDSRSDRHDPFHGVTHRIQCPIISFCHSVKNTKRDENWRNRLLDCGRQLSSVLHRGMDSDNRLSEVWVAQTLRQVLAENPGYELFVGNSMPIRLMDSLTSLSGRKGCPVWANRGISGIDGLLATACGQNQAGLGRTVLLIGDISFLHDLNSLALARQQNLIIVLLNNNGGSIFNLFPVAEDIRARYFRVEHSLHASSAANMFGLTYRQPASRTDFAECLGQALQSEQGCLIEICTPPDEMTDQLIRLRTLARDMVFETSAMVPSC